VRAWRTNTAESLDEPLAAVATGPHAEAEDAAVAATGEDPVGHRLVGRALEARVADPRDVLVALEVLRDLQRVLAVSLHAQVQGLEPLARMATMLSPA
jgi:hypothetical protein